jgi:hypothetical protein
VEVRQISLPHVVEHFGFLLTPKNGTGKELTCGLSLVIKYHSARKDLLRGFGKRSLRSAVHHHSAKGLFALFKGSFLEYVVTWPDIRKERVDGIYEIDIGVGALIQTLNVVLVVDQESCWDKGININP